MKLLTDSIWCNSGRDTRHKPVPVGVECIFCEYRPVNMGQQSGCQYCVERGVEGRATCRRQSICTSSSSLVHGAVFDPFPAESS